MAVNGRTCLRLAKDTNAVTMVTPAEGPSFGMAPAGTWMWMSWVAEEFLVDAPNALALERTQLRPVAWIRAYVLNLGGDGESAFAFHLVGFDEEDIAPDGVQARGRRRRRLGALGDFAFAADF